MVEEPTLARDSNSRSLLDPSILPIVSGEGMNFPQRKSGRWQIDLDTYLVT